MMLVPTARASASIAGAVLLGSVLLLWPARPAHAGYRIVGEEGETILVSKGRVKSVPPEPDRPVTVLDTNRNRIWIAARQQRRYWEGTVEQYCTEVTKALERLAPAMQAEADRQEKERRAKLSPEERAREERARRETEALATPEGQARLKKEMEEWARKMGVDPKELESPEESAAPEKPPMVAIERTGETGKVAGLPARKYRVKLDGEPYQDVWVSTDATFNREMAAVTRALERTASCFEEDVAPEEFDLERTPEYKRFVAREVPLKIVPPEESPDGDSRELVREVQPRDVPDGEFAPPAGFTRSAISEMLPTMMGEQ